MISELLTKTINAIEVLNNQKQGDFQKADEFLVELQKSSDAWSISDQLLRMNKDTFSSYFGAQTMRNKIQLHFEELPVEYQFSLKESLLNQLCNINDIKDTTISNQLCLALADLYCHMVKWNDGFTEIINLLSTKNELIPILLDVLRYLPEESNNKSLRLGVNRCKEVLGQLEANRRNMLSLIEMIVQQYNNEVLLMRSIKCLDSWFQVSLLRDSDMINCSLVRVIFQILINCDNYGNSLVESAAQCAANLFTMDAERFPQFSLQLLQFTSELDNSYCNLTRGDRQISITKIFCECATTLMPYSLQSPRFTEDIKDIYNVRPIQLLLLSARTNAECCVEVVYTLSNILEDNHYINGVCESNSTDSANKLSNLFELLVSEMTKFSVGSQHQDEDSLLKFRQEVYRIMEALRPYLDFDQLFRKLTSLLSQLLSGTTTSASSLGEVEAVLSILGSIVKFVNYDEADINQCLHQLILHFILPNLQTISSKSFQQVVYQMFGELCSWAGKYNDINDGNQQQRPIIDQMLSIMCEKLEENENNLCDSMLVTIGTFARRHPTIILLQTANWKYIQRVCYQLTQITQLTSISSTLLREMTFFYECLGKAVVRHVEDDTHVHVMQLCQINLQQLSNILTNQHPIVQKSSNDPTLWIDNISSLYLAMQGLNKQCSRNLGTNNTSNINNTLQNHFSILQTLIWPAASSMLDVFRSDGRVLERIVRMIRYVIRCLQQTAAPILPVLAEKIVALYSLNHESCLLYLGGILVDEFGVIDTTIAGSAAGVTSAPSSTRQGLLQMYLAFSKSTLISLSAPNSLEQNPNTAEDYFRLTIRLVQHCNPDFLACQQLELDNILNLGLRGILCGNEEASELALRMIQEVLSSCIQPTNTSDMTGITRCSHWLQGEENKGLLRCLSAILTLCKWHTDALLNSNLLDDSASLILSLWHLSSSDIFQYSLHQSLQSLGLQRRDGLLYVTEEQLSEFYSCFQLPHHQHDTINNNNNINTSLLSHQKVSNAVETFARLFS